MAVEQLTVMQFQGGGGRVNDGVGLNKTQSGGEGLCCVEQIL